MNHLWLGLAILLEVVATTALKTSDGMRHWPSSLLALAGYACAFYCLSLALRTIPVGVAYAIWSGVGIVLISVIGYLRFGEYLIPSQWVGMVLISVGVVVLQFPGVRD